MKLSNNFQIGVTLLSLHIPSTSYQNCNFNDSDGSLLVPFQIMSLDRRHAASISDTNQSRSLPDAANSSVFTYPLAGGTATSSVPTNTPLVLPGQPPRTGNTLDSSTLTTNSAPSALAPSAPPALGPAQPPLRNQVDPSSANTTSSGSSKSRANRPGAYQITRTTTGPAQVYRVTVPAGVQPGSEFTVHAGPRRVRVRVRVRCPETSQPGQTLQITVPSESVSNFIPLHSAPLTDLTGAGGGGPVTLSRYVLHVKEQAKESGGKTQTYLVTIPPNTYPGMQFEVHAGRQRFRVSCPESCGPGMRVRIIPPVQRELLAPSL